MSNSKVTKIIKKKMNVEKLLQQLEEEIRNENRSEVIETCEVQLSQKIEELSNFENFFNLPLNNIFSVISKVDFNEIEENDKIKEIIQNIIQNLNNSHPEEKETILVLQNLNIATNSLSYEEIIPLLGLFTNCPILINLCNHIIKINNMLKLIIDMKMNNLNKKY